MRDALWSLVQSGKTGLKHISLMNEIILWMWEEDLLYFYKKNAIAMKNRLSVVIIVLVLVLQHTVQAQFNAFLREGFDTTGQYIDLSTLFIRFGQTEASTAFEIVEKTDSDGLAFQAVKMNEVGEQAGVCCHYEGGNFLAHNCIDFVFPRNIKRSDGDTLRVEFDAIWETDSDGKGEGHKLIAYLVYNYPEGGPGFNVFNDLSQHHYGKPAYQLWILNGTNRAFMTYGGGLTEGAGFIALPASDPQYWLPGFTEKRVEEGEIDQQDPYPLSAYARVMEGNTVSSEYWMRYTWEVTRNRLSLYWRRTGTPEEENVLMFFMETPPDGNLAAINEAHGTAITAPPPFYEYPDDMNAFRMFINKRSYFTNVTISKTGTPLGTYAEFQHVSAARRRVLANAGNYDLPLLLYNGIDGEPTTVTVKLIKGDTGHIDQFTEGTITFPEITGGEMTPLSLALTLTDMYKTENDTLLFEISEIDGGYYPAIGPRRSFELVIRPSGDSPPTGIAAVDRLKDIRIFPNPSSDIVTIGGFADLTGPVQVEVMDVIGKVVARYDNKATDQLDIYNLNNGLYFVRISSPQGLVVRKLIKH